MRIALLFLTLAALSGCGRAPDEVASDAGLTAVEPPVASERPAPAVPPSPPTVTIGAGGDILVHRKVIRSAEEHAAEGGFRHVFGELAEVIRSDEVAIANLETPLSTRIDPRTGDPPVLGTPPGVAAALSDVGLDVVSVANNHSYDQTAAGLADTLAELSHAGILAVGAAPEGRDAAGPVVLSPGGVRVAVVAFTERINASPSTDGPRASRWNDERVSAALARARASAQLVVVSVHWSHDFAAEPQDRQRRRARMMVDAGADFILGHGPHVLQRVERLESPRGEAVVAYSLGNLVSNQGLRYFAGRPVPPPERLHPAVVMPELRDGAWLRASFSLAGGRVRVERLEATPLWTRNNFLEVERRRDPRPRLDIRARPLASAEEAIRLERAPVITSALGELVTVVGPRAGASSPSPPSRPGLAAVAPSPSTDVVTPAPPSPPPSPPPPPAPEPSASEMTSSEAPALAASSVATLPAGEGAPSYRLPVEFNENSRLERSVDDAVIRELADRLRADRTLSVELVGYATAAEAERRPTLARTRARRVMGLIAILGPSRSRFRFEAGPVGAPGVTLRLRRRSGR